MTNTADKRAERQDEEPLANPHARVPPTPENPRGYPPFDMRLVPNYTNKQITYYYTTGAIPAADQGQFQKLMEQRKTSLDLIGWDGESSDDGNNNNRPESSNTADIHSDSDSDCPAAPEGFKPIKISPSDIPKLQYESTVAQYNNWLVDLKTAFDGDPAKYSTSRKKVILAQVTLDEKLKTIFNSASEATPILLRHWRKFKRWTYDTVLHQGSDKLKLSSDFTATRQSINEDPNQFFNRLFNLGIQSGRTVTVEDYRTRLLRPLRNLMDQHDREYPTVQDVVTHAGKLWQTLDRDKLRQELREDREKARQQRNAKQPNRPTSSRDDRYQSRRHSDKRQDSQRGSHQDQDPQRDQKPKDPKPRLPANEQKHRQDNNLCFNCGYPGHQSRDCTYPFNPNRVQLKDDKGKAKSQLTQAHSKKRARVQPTRAESPSDPDYPDVHTTDDSDQSESERPSKRQKN